MSKLQKLTSVQNFSPIRDVERGIIITTDGRFIKLMEISPVNFELRSIEEQNGIISQFGAVLRSMPKTIQFKVVTKRADNSSHINNLVECMEAEENENCRAMDEEQIKFIMSGSTAGTSRRFFIAFEYETPAGMKKAESFPAIAATLDRQAAAIAAALKSCGNEKISIDDDDEWTLDALYNIFCRATSDNATFMERVASVVANYAAENHLSNQDALNLPVNNFICPSYIDPGRSPNYLVVDDVYYSFCIIRGDSYPTYAAGGWTQLLIGLGEGIDLDIWLHKEDPEAIQRKIQYKLRANNVKLRKTEDTSQDFDSIRAALESGYYLKSGIASADDFCYFGAMLTITANSVEDLERRVNEIKAICIRSDLKIRQCTFQQLDAFKMTIPVCKIESSLWGKMRRNILLSQFASAYPFTSFEMSDNAGVLLGTSVQNGSMVFLNPHDNTKYTNANIVIFGASGGGKSYLLQTFALRKRMNREQVFTIVPMKGEEFEAACRAIGGEFIRIAPGSNQNINVMEIRKKDMVAAKEAEGDSDSILAQKIQQLHTFFALLFPDVHHPMTQAEKNILDRALIETYGKLGITTSNEWTKSRRLNDPANPTFYKKMPILGDLYRELKKQEGDNSRLLNALEIFVTGSASSFNQPTNVNLDNKYIVIDVSRLPKELLPVGMFIATDYVWDKAREDRTKRKTIIIDEVWRLIGGFASSLSAEFVLDIFKVVRGYGGSAVAATQDLNDVLTLNGGQFGSAILNNTRIKMILRVESQNEADALGDVLELTEKEVETLRMMERGTALLIANFNHLFVKIKATKMEHELIRYRGAR